MDKCTFPPLEESYSPGNFEQELYQFWVKSGCFDSFDDLVKGEEAYCIAIPPPNVTGALHMGHALTLTIEDILIRYARMKHKNTLWIPGVDHAGIATQMVVERALAPKTRHDLGREKFLEKVWEWKKQYGDRITLQMRRLGASLDWKRERFTMDEGFSKAVKKVFVNLFNDGLIYRGERMTNWCQRCQTALSDLEVVPTEKKGKLWSILYKGGTKGIVVATTRPETLLGDTAVAVHPNDPKYKLFKDQELELPLLKRKIPVIFDDAVDQSFGTGAVKVTPAHDFSDFEMGQRHSLPRIQVIGFDGKMTKEGGPYVGLSIQQAREKVLEDLKSEGLLVEEKDYINKVGVCQRCERVADPMVSKQWFVKIKPLADPALKAVEKGKIKFIPQTWENTYFEWMNGIRDWCISRQLWWGHQIPAWYCEKCKEATVSEETPQKCSHCGDRKLKQDEDVLDTWFSSGLWPFVTLGWPEKTSALKTFYPNSVMETGFDIIFFWVARMIMMGLHFMKQVPFKEVFFHAMVRDEKGQKMSKSKGNVVDPLEVMNKWGADPLRFTLAIMAGQGRDIKLSLERVEGYRGFCNKLWNAVRYFHFQAGKIEGFQKNTGPYATFKEGGLEGWIEDNYKEFNLTNRWILSRLSSVLQKVEQDFKDYEMNQACQKLYDFTWHEFCDWYIEFSKIPLGRTEENQIETLAVLHFVLERVLKALHPFIPFVTERLWLSLPWRHLEAHPFRKKRDLPEIETLSLQAYPTVQKKYLADKVENEIDHVKNIVEAIRAFRGENRVSLKKEIEVYFSTNSVETHKLVDQFHPEILSLARLSLFEHSKKTMDFKGATLIPLSNPPLELQIPMAGLVDLESEAARIRKEIAEIQKELEKVERKLSNEGFVSRAPQEVVAGEKKKADELKAQLQDYQSNLKKFKK